MKKSKYDGVYTDGRDFYTKSPIGESVYGERVLKINGKFFRKWIPSRSKLAAALKKNIRTFPFKNAKILYLGASTGTTVSHLSDITEDIIWAVEVSPISIYKLVALAKKRKNIVPILDDAHYPENYSVLVESPDVIYQDISQRDQTNIFIKNMMFFKPEIGFLMLKTRTINMREKPREVLKTEVHKIEEHFNIVEIKDISRFQKDHFVLVVKR